MRPALASASLVIAALLEAWLLYLITHHPAGGWGPNLAEAWRSLMLYALVPIGVVLVPVIRSLSREQLAPRTLKLVLAFSATGPTALLLALSSYGHGMFMPMFLGFVLQLSFAVACLLFTVPKN